MNNEKSSDYNQVILVHIDVVHRPTPESETCDDSILIVRMLKTASEHTQFMVPPPPPPPPPINIKLDLGFPRE